MSEVSAPVVAIAFILAAVFIPVAFLGGISGQIYKQFALTIAVSVLLSAFNALSLSPALSAICSGPKQTKRSPLALFFDRFNSGFGYTTGPLSVFGEVSEPPRAGGPGRAGHPYAGRRAALSGSARGVPAGRGPGRVLRLGPPARRRVDGPHRRGHAQDRDRSSAACRESHTYFTIGGLDIATGPPIPTSPRSSRR